MTHRQPVPRKGGQSFPWQAEERRRRRRDCRARFVGLRIAVHGAATSPGAESSAGIHDPATPDYLRDGVAEAETDYRPLAFPELTAPDDLVHFDRPGSAMRYMLPKNADVNDALVQTFGTIALSVARDSTGSR